MYDNSSVLDVSSHSILQTDALVEGGKHGRGVAC